MCIRDSYSTIRILQYSYGTIDPYKSSEWFYNFQDTVKVRSNWDIELQEIKLDLEF